MRSVTDGYGAAFSFENIVPRKSSQGSKAGVPLELHFLNFELLHLYFRLRSAGNTFKRRKGVAHLTPMIARNSI